MNSILTLMKANITNSWGINKVLKSKSKGEKIKALLLGIVIVYAFCMLLVTMFIFNLPLAQGLKQFNALDMMLSSSIISATFLSLVMCVYKIPSYLFAFKDYDLLMSLPIKPYAVLTSKMIFIYMSNLLMTIMVSVPPLIIYGYETSASFSYYVYVAVLTLFIPLIPISIGAFFAYYLGRLSSRLRSTNIIMMIGSLLLIVLFIIVSPMIGQLKPEQIQGALPTVNTIDTVLFWTKLFVRALRDGNVLYFFGFILLSVLVFTIFIGVLAKGFKSINSKMSEKYKASNYKMSRLKVSSPFKALYIKELRFYFSSFIYVVNTAMGPLMMTVFALGMTIFGRETIAKILELPMAEALFAPITALMFSFCISLTFITAPAISLEGKSLWIIKSLPIDVKSILWSKILLNLTLTVPALFINVLIIGIGFRYDVLTMFSIFAVSLMYCVFSAVMGLIVNLYNPKLEWTTQIAVVKQSASVLLDMVVSFVSIIIPIVLFVLIKPASMILFLLVFSLVMLVINLFLVRFLNTTGVRKFIEL